MKEFKCVNLRVMTVDELVAGEKYSTNHLLQVH